MVADTRFSEYRSIATGMRTRWQIIYLLLAIWVLATLLLDTEVFIRQIISGLVFGIILVMIALGLSLILGLMGVVNFAHGAFFTLGAYLAFAFISQSGMSYWLVFLLVPICVGLIGIATEVTTIRPLYDKDPVTGLLLTFGLAIVIQVVIRIFYSSQTRTIPTPNSLNSPVSLGIISIAGIRLFAVLIGVTTVVGVFYVIHHTNLGLVIRASVQDSEMARMTGINVSRYLTIMFGLGVALAGVAGMIRGSEVGIFPGMGGNFIILVFVIVVVGGMGSLFGSVVGGMLIGIVQFIGPTMMGLVIDLEAYGLGGIDSLIPFLIMIVVLLDRPRGLFGEEGFLE